MILIKRAVLRVLRSLGYELHRIGHAPARHSGPTMASALERLHRRDAKIFQTAIDVGASTGCWSAELMRYYPDASYLLIEAQPDHEPALQAFCAANPKARYTLAAAGPTEGQTYFEAGDLWGGVASFTPVAQNQIIVPVTQDRHANPPARSARPLSAQVRHPRLRVADFGGRDAHAR